jgi:hypothetical protein
MQAVLILMVLFLVIGLFARKYSTAIRWLVLTILFAFVIYVTIRLP